MGKFDGILICSDIDGTLLSLDTKPVDNEVKHYITDKNAAALKYFTDEGGLFTVCTGRLPDFVGRLDAPINAPLICSNGALVYDSIKKEVIRESVITDPPADVFAFVKQLGGIERAVLSAAGDGWMELKPDEDWNTFLSVDKPYRYLFEFTTIAQAEETERRLIESFGDRYIFNRSWPRGLELISLTGSKGAAALYLKELLGCHTLVGAGDFENDETLIIAADIGCAMDNGIDNLKAVADHVVPNKQDSSGIAYIINNLL